MDIIKFVQRRLWCNGHKTKRMPKGMGFDLIVDGKWKTGVIKGNPLRIKITNQADDCVTAIVCDTPDKKTTIYYTRDGVTIHGNFKDAIKTGKAVTTR